MPLTIKEQVEVANEVNDLLKTFGEVHLAGGAPRDWFLGNNARDLDFYYYSQYSPYSLFPEDTIIKSLGGNDTYPGEQILSVYEVECKGIPINIIYINNNLSVEDIVATFPIALSRFYFNFEDQACVASSLARLSIANKAIIPLVDAEVENTEQYKNYLLKIRTKFPNYVEKSLMQISKDLLKSSTDSVREFKHISPELIFGNTMGMSVGMLQTPTIFGNADMARLEAAYEVLRGRL